MTDQMPIVCRADQTWWLRSFDYFISWITLMTGNQSKGRLHVHARDTISLRPALSNNHELYECCASDICKLAGKFDCFKNLALGLWYVGQLWCYLNHLCICCKAACQMPADTSLCSFVDCCRTCSKKKLLKFTSMTHRTHIYRGALTGAYKTSGPYLHHTRYQARIQAIYSAYTTLSWVVVVSSLAVVWHSMPDLR